MGNSGICVCVCVCETLQNGEQWCVCVCVCEKHCRMGHGVCVCVCVCVCVRETLQNGELCVCVHAHALQAKVRQQGAISRKGRTIALK